MAAADVLAFHETLSNWGRWGADDQLGVLNVITPEVTAGAVATVRTGRTVSCARPLDTVSSADNPSPVAHHMTGTATEGMGADYFAISPHGFSTSHIDALCHIFFAGQLYNGYPAESVTAHGATKLGIHQLRAGIVTRTPYQQRPVRYAYTLTPKGSALGEVLRALVRWGKQHIPGTMTLNQVTAGGEAAVPAKSSRRRRSRRVECRADPVVLGNHESAKRQGVPMLWVPVKLKGSPIHGIGIFASQAIEADTQELYGVDFAARDMDADEELTVDYGIVEGRPP